MHGETVARAAQNAFHVMRLAARVVATSSDEVKLVFDKADQELYRLLRGLMTVH